MVDADRKATVGLRGLASLHVMVRVNYFKHIAQCKAINLKLFHYLGHMTYGDVDIHGSLELSTFFLLSGFCLALRYGEEGLQGSYSKFILLRMTKYVSKSKFKAYSCHNFVQVATHLLHCKYSCSFVPVGLLIFLFE